MFINLEDLIGKWAVVQQSLYVYRWRSKIYSFAEKTRKKYVALLHETFLTQTLTTENNMNITLLIKEKQTKPIHSISSQQCGLIRA